MKALQAVAFVTRVLRSRGRPIIGAALCAASAILSAPVAQAQNCLQPPNSIRVNDNYVPDQNGNWWLIPNWVDLNGDSKFNLPAGNEDFFNAHDPSNVLIPIADPTILKITSQYGTWYYITGTSAQYQAGNFPIYRTQDFATFELHMTAFDEANLGGSGQYRSGRTIYLNNGKRFFSLWAPQLYRDPTLVAPPVQTGGSTNGGTDGDGTGGDTSDDSTGGDDTGVVPEDEVPIPTDAVSDGTTDESSFDMANSTGQTDPWIFLNFSAVENLDANDNNEQYHSCFHVRMRQSKFLSWHNRSPGVNGPRFADKRDGYGWQAWYGYLGTTTRYMYDGGYSIGGRVPASGSTALLGTTCGKLMQRGFGLSHRCGSLMTWMSIDPFLYVDPTLPNNSLWKRPMTFVWDDRDRTLPFNLWGNHVATHPARAEQFIFDTRAGTEALAVNRNSLNQIYAGLIPGWTTFGWIYNGASGGMGHEWPGGAVAENSSAFYNPQTRRHYVIYNRNVWASPAYQLLYRMTDQDAPFTSLTIVNPENFDVPERILLRADDYSFNTTETDKKGQLRQRRSVHDNGWDWGAAVLPAAARQVRWIGHPHVFLQGADVQPSHR